MSVAVSRDEGRLAAREWVWLVLASLVIACVAEAPAIVSELRPPRGLVAVYPSVVAAEDYPQYRGAMFDAIDSGTWLSIDHFSTEPHRAIVLRPFYTFSGRIAGALRASPDRVYRFATFGGRVLLCLAIYLLMAVCFAPPATRVAGLAITLTTSGLLGVLDLSSGLVPESVLRLFEQRLERPEYSTFLVLFHHPHLIVALALMLLLARSAIVTSVSPRGVLRGSAHGLVIAALVAGIALANPFTTVPACAAVALFCVLVLHDERHQLGRGFRRVWPVAAGGAVGLIVAARLFLVSAVTTFHHDPFWSLTYGRPRGQWTPPWTVIVFHLFFLLALAAAGAPRFFREAGRPASDLTRTSRRWVAAWIGATVALMVVSPGSFPLRFAFGLQPFVAIVATGAAVWLWYRFRESPVGGAVLVTVALAALLTPLAYSRVLVLSVRGELLAELRYRTEAEVLGAEWLREHSGPQDRVLCAYSTGNFLGGRIRGRVYVGHDSGTLNIDDKIVEVRGWFEGTASPESKRRFLRERGIDYLWLGPVERAAASPSTLSLVAGAEPVFERADVTLFRVEQLEEPSGRQ